MEALTGSSSSAVFQAVSSLKLLPPVRLEHNLEQSALLYKFLCSNYFNFPAGPVWDDLHY